VTPLPIEKPGHSAAPSPKNASDGLRAATFSHLNARLEAVIHGAR